MASGDTVTYTIDPRIPHRKKIIKEIEKYNDLLQGYLEFRFAGYAKLQKQNTNYHIRIRRKFDPKPTSRAFLRYLDVEPDDSKARIKSAIIVLNDKKLKKSSDYVHAVAHELIGHGSGLGHSADKNSLMYGIYTGAKALSSADIEKIKSKYTY